MSWNKVKLLELVSTTKGKKHTEVDDTLANRYIQIEDLTGHENPKFTNDKGVQVVSNDVIIAWDGANAGKVGTKLKGIIGSTLARLRPLTVDINGTFLFRFLQSKESEIKSKRTGATIPHVNGPELRDLTIPLPPLPIQQKIAAILDQADALRKKDQQLLEKYDELLQAVFYDMFGDPVRNEKGWDKVELKEISSEIVDCPHSTPVKAKKKTDYACIRTSELKEGSIFWDSMQYVEASEYAKRVGRLIPKEGDIVYGREGSFGEAIIIPPYPKFCLGQRTMLFRPNYKKCNSLFLWAIVRSDYVYNQALRKNSGSTVGHVNVKDIKEFTVILPSIEVQNKYSIIVANILDQKRQAKQHVDQSENLFQSLLQRAFRG